jgi:predicted kinase
MKTPTLYLMFGYPGAGKTTAAKLIHEVTGASRLSSDELRLELFPHPTYSENEHQAVYQTLDEQVEKLLRQGKDVIYDANLNRRAHRDEKYTICRHTNAKAVLVWVKAPRDLSKERAIIRGHSHLVPADETFESMFERVADTLEPPTEDEPVHGIDGTKLNRENIDQFLKTL